MTTRELAIRTSGLRKEFRYINPKSGMATSDQWLDYAISYLTGAKRGASGVQKRHVVAVDSLDLSVQRGEFFGLLGPNGAGKTTSIKILSTVLAPTAGAATINGFDLQKQREEVKASINVVQSGGWLGFDHQVTIRWNLEIWGRIYGLTRAQARNRVEEVLELVGLADKANDSSGTLSSGQRQRLALAKGLLVQAPILLCDEPTVALDPAAAHGVRQFIKNEINRRHGQTVLLTTHLMHEAEQLCDRVAIMDVGRIIVCDTPDTLCAQLAAHPVTCRVAGFSVDTLTRIKSMHPKWHVTDKLDQAGNGAIRVLLPSEADGSDVPVAIKECGAVAQEWAPERVTLEDVFISLTGRRLAS